MPIEFWALNELARMHVNLDNWFPTRKARVYSSSLCFLARELEISASKTGASEFHYTSRVLAYTHFRCTEEWDASKSGGFRGGLYLLLFRRGGEWAVVGKKYIGDGFWLIDSLEHVSWRFRQRKIIWHCACRIKRFNNKYNIDTKVNKLCSLLPAITAQNQTLDPENNKGKFIIQA